MMKKIFNLLLMAAVVCGLSLFVTSCKDDDDDNGGGNNTEVGGATVNELGLTDDETVLASLLQRWCDVEPQDIKSGIISQQFEPTVGKVLDAANPYVRSIVVETQEAADAYVASALSVLNINGKQPDGFSWTNAAIGTISYRHGSGNDLGVLTINIKQIPHLTSLRLTAKADDNDNVQAYYKKGDVVKYTGSDKELKDKYFVCVSDHLGGQDAEFVSFDVDGDKPSTGDCNWMMTGKDYVYNKSQASMTTLLHWLNAFVIDDDGYDALYRNLQEVGSTGDNIINQLVPKNDEYRAKLLRGLIRKSDQIVLDAWQPYTNGGSDIQAVKVGWKTATEKEKSSYVVERYTPYSLLLCNTMRWSMGTTYDYWVPNLSLVKEDGSTLAFEQRLTQTPSQSTLSKSHFVWQSLEGVSLKSRVLDANENGRYTLYMSSVHWTHDEFKIPDDNKKHYGLLDFTKSKAQADQNDWTRHCISSHELTFTDKGTAYKYFTDVFSSKRTTVRPDGFFTVGSVIKDEQGTQWMCFSGWVNNGSFRSKDMKARFFSLQNIRTAEETVSGSNQKGTFAVGDLMPEDEAPLFAFFLKWASQFCEEATPSKISNIEFKNTFTSFSEIKPEDLVLSRDSTYTYPDGDKSNCNIYFTNVAYIPNNGRTTGTQPYMRYIQDNTLCGSRRTAHTATAYPKTRFNTIYSGGTGKMDLTHLFTASSYIADKGTIKADAYSRCKRTKDGVRDGDFTAQDRYTENYNFKLFSSDMSKFKSAYHEPVIVARYLELDDPGDNFKGTYNGHTYTLVSQPSDNLKFIMTFGEFVNGLMWTVNTSTFAKTVKDGQLYKLPYIAWAEE